MNLIINPNPKEDHYSLSATLAARLAHHLSGETKTIRIYEGPQNYFQYQCHQPWIDLMIEAAVLIIPVPMWNFTIPAALKDFFDKITKEGQLWRLGEDKNSFVGLLKDRPVYIIMTSGLIYPPGDKRDFVIPYLKEFFAFLGIRNVKDFRVGGVTNSPELVQNADYMEKTTKKMFAAFDLPLDGNR